MKQKFNIVLRDTSRNVDESLHRKLKRWFKPVESVFYDFMIKTLKLKDKDIDSVELNLTLCGKVKIRSLNRDYRNLDKVTDVLSFPIYGSLRPGQKDEFVFRNIELGDVVICIPVAHKQCKEFGITVDQEIVHQLVHGFLHVTGFDHELSEAEEKLMFKYEEQLVEKIYGAR